MQIFYVHEDPYEAAHFLCDAHIRKQTVETAQILSTAIRTLLKDDVVDMSGLYKSYNPNHPIMKWAGYSFDNFHWAYFHFLALLQEYSYRTGKIHGSLKGLPEIRKFYYHIFQHKEILFHNKGFKAPLCGIDIDCIVPDDEVESYRRYYKAHKLWFAKWTRREVPEWVFE